MPVDVDERRWPERPPDAYASRVALAKARAGQARHPADVVLGADTIVVVDGDVLGKPANDAEARRDAGAALRPRARSADGRRARLARARARRSWSARASGSRRSIGDEIRVVRRERRAADKAGAYAIQGLASRFVPRIDGSYSNVVGLPVAAVLQLLREAGRRAARFEVDSGETGPYSVWARSRQRRRSGTEH